MRIAEKLEEREKEILEVNLEDVDAAEKRYVRERERDYCCC